MEVFILDILCSTEENKIVVRTVFNVVSFKCRCVKCGKSFATHATLQNHVKNCHFIKIVGGNEIQQQSCASIPDILTLVSRIVNPASQLRDTPVVPTTAQSMMWGQLAGTDQLIGNMSSPMVRGTDQFSSNSGILHRTVHPVSTHSGDDQVPGSVNYSSFHQGTNQLLSNTAIPHISDTSSLLSIQNGGTHRVPDNIQFHLIIQDIDQLPAIPLVSTTTIPISKHQVGSDHLQDMSTVSIPLDTGNDHKHVLSNAANTVLSEISKVEIKTEQMASSDDELSSPVSNSHSVVDPQFQGDNVNIRTGQASTSPRSAEEMDIVEDKTDPGLIHTGRIDGDHFDVTSFEEDIKPIMPVALFVSQIGTDLNTNTPETFPISKVNCLEGYVEYTQCHICGENLTTPLALQLHIGLVHESDADRATAPSSTDETSCLIDGTGSAERNITKCSEMTVIEGMHIDNAGVDNSSAFSRPEDDDPVAIALNIKANLRKVNNLQLVYPSLSGARGTGCPICGKTLSTPVNMRIHFHQVHSGNRPFVCNICGKGFARGCDRRRHITIHGHDGGRKTYKCTECQSVFTSAGALDLHRSIQHSDVKPYSCITCAKTFQLKKLLNRHVKIHDPKCKSKSLCHLCGVTINKTDSTNHRLTHHSENRERFVCPICGKSFKENTSLKVHNRTHTGVKPYKCNICGQSFTRNSVLVVHKRSHTGEKPYPCQVCGKAFATSSDLGKHTRTHSGRPERRFRCTHATPGDSICGKSFARRDAFNRHNWSCHVMENPVMISAIPETHS